MNSSIYKEVVERIILGYAYNKIILDDKGIPIDYQILDANNAFEIYTGLKLEEIINKAFISEIIKESKDEFDWASLYGDVALNNKSLELDVYSNDFKRYYQIKAFSPKKYYFITIFKDKTIEREVQEVSKCFLNDTSIEIDYQKITDLVVKITGAKYAVFNLNDINSKDFKTVAISGPSDHIKKVSKLLEFDLLNKKWKYDPEREKEIQDKLITSYENLHQLTKDVLPLNIVLYIEKILNIGQTIVARILKDEKRIGDFTILFGKDIKLTNKETFGIFLNQVGMFIERKRVEKELMIQTEFDSLTGAYNSTILENKKVDNKLSKAKEKGLTCCICVISIDDFKEINISNGYLIGNRVLQYMSKRIMGSLREGDMLIRIGQNEFLIYLHDIKNKNCAESVIKRLMKKCSTTYRMGDELESEKFNLKISLSMGVTLFPDNGEELEKLIINANSALYMAKEVGRGNYFFYDLNKINLKVKIFEERQKIYKYLKEDKIEPFYQPIMNNKGEIVRVEALARIVKSKKEIIFPAYFIPLSEETELIEKIGDEIFKKVIKDIISWKKQNRELIVSINLSTRQLNMDFYNKVVKEVSESSISFKNIIFEIIEENIIDTANETIEVLELFRKLGIKISIDDFGVGYSSLSRIANLPKDEIKIDKSFLKDIVDEKKSKLNRIIIKALNNLAKDMEVDIVIEGVETKEEFKILTKLGCNLMQGFYFSEALPKETFDKMYIK